MISKEKLRKKFLFLRKKRYFSVNINFFKPLFKILKIKKSKSISLYYPSNYEFDTNKLFELLKFRKNFSTLLPIISSKNSMKFIKWKLSEPLWWRCFSCKLHIRWLLWRVIWFLWFFINRSGIRWWDNSSIDFWLCWSK